MEAASDYDTIDFASNVTKITLEATATSGVANLTMTDDRMSGVDAMIEQLLGAYGIDGVPGSVSLTDAIAAAIADLSPGVEIEGGGGTNIDFWTSTVAEERSA
jgi:hypothetical protein